MTKVFCITLGSFSNPPEKNGKQNINYFHPLLHKVKHRGLSTRLRSRFMALHGGTFTREHMSGHYLGDKVITVKSRQGSAGVALRVMTLGSNNEPAYY